MKKILVTGSAGFVGKHMLCSLAEEPDWQIYAGVLNEQEKQTVETVFENIPEKQNRTAWQTVQMNITNRQQVLQVVEKVQPDAIIHLAAQASVARSFREPELTMEMNVEGTRNLLDGVVSAKSSPRILLIGSADQYGNVAVDQQPIREEQPLQAGSPYGKSKVQQEELAQKYRQMYGLECIVVRSAPHTGPGQSPQFAIPDWCQQILEMKTTGNRELLVGDLTVVRDLTDVRDVVCAYKALLEVSNPKFVYNVGTARGICLRELPEIIAACVGISDLQVVVDPKKLRPVEIPVLIVDNSRLRQQTGWKPTYSIEQTIADMITQWDSR